MRAYRHLTLALLACSTAWLAATAALAGPVDELVAQVSATTYRHYLDDLLYTHLGQNRGYGAEHDLARQNIFDHFQSLGLTTSLEPFEYGNTYYNVVGVHEGYTRPEQIYIVGAHFDSANTPGADDNGSGTACVMELARVIASHRFEATIVLIAFDREEQGLYGSKAYAQSHSGDDIRGMISTDMIAFNPGGANRASIYGRTSSDPCKQALGDALTQWTGIEPIYHGSMDRSDHAPFEWEGFEAALLIEDEWGSNPHYHRSTDSVDTPDYIDYDFAADMTRGVLGWLATAATPIDAVLAGPVPGIAGQVNQWTITGATPDTRTYFVYSMANGSHEVPGCPGVTVQMAAPIIAGSIVTDGNGDGTFARFVPAGASGRSIGLQAAQPASCMISNADWHQFE
ncbi:MAG: Zn-dependent exopeptidase M28 [Phycisphaerales bacterium]|nr:Zn-dependent exopeptidase M28 [Phycisphaerales bacterium]